MTFVLEHFLEDHSHFFQIQVGIRIRGIHLHEMAYRFKNRRQVVTFLALVYVVFPEPLYQPFADFFDRARAREKHAPA
jgi:hypothetical protein